MSADSLATSWEWALDAAARAIDAGGGQHLRAGVVERERSLLARERQEVAELLHQLAADRGGAIDAWLPQHSVTPRLLGLPPTTQAVLLDLDGVLTDSNALHATTWADVLDPVLLRVAHELGWAFVPFDRREEYALYFDGRPRREGIRLFLSSRGIHLPAGELDKIAAHKSERVAGRLRDRSLVTLPGARRYLQAAAHARIASAVVSASESTRCMLELARLDHLVDSVIDADEIRHRGLRSRPAPDPLLAACADLGVNPEHAVSLTHSGAGVTAALKGGLGVRGIGSGDSADRLHGLGAEAIAPSLLALLDPSIRGVPDESSLPNAAGGQFVFT